MDQTQQFIKKLDRVAWVLSIMVLALVIMMRRIKIETEFDFSMLPAFHALLNSIAAVMLIFGYRAIRQKKVAAHKLWMSSALVVSVLFLFSYVVYHITTPETKYGGEGLMRGIYFFFLITHVILAGLILPFILFTFIRGYSGAIERHRRLARWVFPFWLYVAITGPICYFMLKPYYAT